VDRCCHVSFVLWVPPSPARAPCHPLCFLSVSLSTAFLSNIPHFNSSKRVLNRPLRGRTGRFGTLLQLLECGSFERTPVRLDVRPLSPDGPVCGPIYCGTVSSCICSTTASDSSLQHDQAWRREREKMDLASGLQDGSSTCCR